MGIKKILDIVRNNAPQALSDKSLIKFKGKRIAIDGTNWIHTTWAIAWKVTVNRTNIGEEEPDREEARKIWVKNVQRFINKLLINGITPIFVMDGKHPEEKAGTQEKRKEIREKSKEKLEVMKEKIKERRENEGGEEKIKEGGKEEINLDEVRRSYTNNMNLSYNETELMIIMCKAVGIPIIQAKGEAEELCSMMCREGIVEGVYTTDTDPLAYGCPLFLKGMNKRGDGFTTVDLKIILESLKISFETFVDLCIMCGCDYNKNIPKIGEKSAYALMKQYGRIENLPKSYRNVPLDLNILNYERCREIFKSKQVSELYDGEYQIDINKERLLSAKEILGNEVWIEELGRIYKNL